MTGLEIETFFTVFFLSPSPTDQVFESYDNTPSKAAPTKENLPAARENAAT